MLKQQRAADTRESIVIAAAKVFAADGYRATTLNDVTRAAEVTQGAIYFHFGSKQELASEIIRRQHELSIAAGAKQLESDGSGIEGMIILSASLADQILRNPIVRAGLRLSTESASDLPDQSVVPYVEWIASCRRFLERAEEQGELRPWLDLDAASEVVISSFTGTQFVSTALAGGADLITRLERMWTILLPAIVTGEGMIRESDLQRLLRSSPLV